MKGISKLVSSIMEDVGGKWKDAHQSLLRYAEKDEELYSHLASTGAWYLVRQSSANFRREVRSSGILDMVAESTIDEVRRESIERRHSAFEYPLRGGIALGEAPICDVREEARLRIRLGEQNLAEGKWLMSIADIAAARANDESVKISDVMTEADILTVPGFPVKQTVSAEEESESDIE